MDGVLPFGSLPPKLEMRSGFLRNSTTSCSSCFASAAPFTSSNVTSISSGCTSCAPPMSARRNGLPAEESASSQSHAADVKRLPKIPRRITIISTKARASLNVEKTRHLLPFSDFFDAAKYPSANAICSSDRVSHEGEATSRTRTRSFSS